MNVRRATADDVEAVRRVARAAWEADYPDILSRETVEDGVEEWYDPDLLARDLRRSGTEVLVAETDEGVVGFAHALWNREEGDLLRLYVHPDHRLSGVGGALLDATEERLFDRGVERVRAMVLAANEVGNAFYESRGFDFDDEGETTIGGRAYAENAYVLERDDR